MLQTLPADARQAFADLQNHVIGLEKIIQLQREEIRLLNHKIFGPKSEKLSPAQMSLLLGEISLRAGEVDQEAGRPEAEKQDPLPQAKKLRANHPGRAPLPAHLETREIIIPCCPQDCTCSQCGAQRPVIGYEIREELGMEPARFYKKIIKREKRGSHCLEEQGVATAPAPAQIVPKSKLSNELVIELLMQKFQQHVPVFRFCAWLSNNHGIDLSRKTLNDGLLGAGGLLMAVVRAQAANWWLVLIFRLTKRPCLARLPKKLDAIIGLTSGNTASRAGQWSSTSKWGVDEKARRSS